MIQITDEEREAAIKRDLQDRKKYYDKGRKGMVGWFAKQMFKTALDVLISTKLSSSHDVRVFNAIIAKTRALSHPQLGNINAIHRSPFPFEDHSTSRWVDFMADTGDGFNSSYSVVYLLTRPTLELKDGDETYNTERGSLLILGGDLAYPAPTVESYDLRFKKLFEMAFPWSDSTVKGCSKGSPKCLSIPGNHDWYDSLTVFSSLFLNGRSADNLYGALDDRIYAKLKKAENHVWLGGYTLGQDQTYFAIKLPEGWWAFGVDLGLYNDIDINQLRYFMGVAATLDSNNTNIVIICHEPLWWFRGFNQYPMNLNKLFTTCSEDFGLRIKLWLAGDVHNYRRDTEVLNESKNLIQKIEEKVVKVEQKVEEIVSSKKKNEAKKAETKAETKGLLQQEVNKSKAPQYHKIIAGGGGAFLHPTWVGHDSNAGHSDTIRKYKKAVVYPSVGTCYKLNFLNLLFPFYNLSFGLVTAVLYTLIMWWVKSESRKASFIHAFLEFSNPMPAMLSAVLALGCIYFSAGSARMKAFQGTLHFAAQMAGINLVYYVAHLISRDIVVPHYASLANGAVYIIGGYLLGSFIMGLYLFVSALLGTHWNEATGSIKCEDYKNFMRFHITDSGDLEIFAIGIDKTNKNWQCSEKLDYREPLIKPKEGSDVNYRLIERIVISKKD